MPIRALTHIGPPYGCQWCGEEQSRHGRRWHPTAGTHQWQKPSDSLIKARMIARRANREAEQ